MTLQSARVAAAAAWLPPLAAGAVLRLWNLHRQILLDDEMHTVGTALYVPFREIVSSFKSEDPCLPLTAFYRALLEMGLPFSEMTFRVPVVLASLASIVVLPRLALPEVGRRAAVVLAWLLALSPTLAIYAGMVRPYGVISLLAPAAPLLALRWRATARVRWGIAYAVVVALCLWFHLATAPLLLTPFGLLVIEAVVQRARTATGPVAGTGVSLRDLAIVGLTALLLIAAFIVPAWESLRELYAVKSGLAFFSFKLVPMILRLQSGTTDTGLALPATIVFWAAAAGGLAVLARSRPAVAVHVVAATLAQWIGLAILAPIGLTNPIIFNRYLIGTLPLVLMLIAVGLVAAAAAVPRLRSGAALAVPVAALVLLLAAGPFADPIFRRSSFQHSKDFIRFDQRRGRMDDALVPPFYRSPEIRDSGRPIIEFPFRGGWSATRAHYIYQSVHGLPVLAAEPYGWTCNGRLRLRNHVCSNAAGMLASRARYLIVHRDPLAEERPIRGGDNSGNVYHPEEWGEFARVAEKAVRGLRRRWGEPLLRDEQIVVWDLDAVRSRLAAAAGAPARAPNRSEPH